MPGMHLWRYPKDRSRQASTISREETMQSTKYQSIKIFSLVIISFCLMGAGGPRGLNGDAYTELSDAGVDKYLGAFTPVMSTDVGDGWTKHSFDPAGGAGPICIAGTPFSAFT